MSYEFKTHGDLADFLERLLRGQMQDRWEIDDFESNFIARKPGQKGWALELWRRCIIDTASAKLPPPPSHWMHPDARPYIEKIMEVLRYIDENVNDDSPTS